MTTVQETSTPAAATQVAAAAVDKKERNRKPLHIFYKTVDGENEMTEFKSKADFDSWMIRTNATVLKVILGVEKKIKVNKVTFA